MVSLKQKKQSLMMLQRKNLVNLLQFLSNPPLNQANNNLPMFHSNFLLQQEAQNTTLENISKLSFNLEFEIIITKDSSFDRFRT
jgi:hypothetical protein